jgi:hypothetical protein
MRYLFILILFSISFLTHAQSSDEDLFECVSKVESKWGEPCGNRCPIYEDSYTIIYKNNCSTPVDIQIALQNENNVWNVFEKYDMQPGDTIQGCACKGTGKIMRYIRVAGDNEVKFKNVHERASILRDLYKDEKD